MWIVAFDIKIPPHEIEFSYVRSSGPGGQNVNKVNSKAILRWNPSRSASIPPGALARFRARFGSRLTEAGDLVLTSDRFREQGRNREDCIEKLRLMLIEIARSPKRRRKTKPSRSSVEKRKDGKRRDSSKKKNRGRVSRWDH